MENNETTPKTRGTIAVAVTALVVLVAATGVVMAAGGTSVSIAPGTDSVDVGETATFEVVVDEASGGVGAAEIGIAVDDPSVAEITDVSVLGSGVQTVAIADDGASADVEYAFRDTADTGSVPVVEVTVGGQASGETGLSLEAAEGNDDVVVYDEEGIGYDLTGTNGATLTVEESTSPPTDPPDPANFQVSNLDAAPSSPTQGDTITISATIENTGEEGETQTAVFSFDGADLQGQEVQLAGGESATVDLGGIDTGNYAPGTYSYGVSTDDDSESGQITIDESDQNEDPSASFTADPSSPEAGQSVSFDASGSGDSDGSIASYEWDFGDGESATGASPSHTYDSAGDYDVTLTVEDDDGATATAKQTVSVNEAPDPASFQITDLDAPSSATQGDTITISATIENTGDEEATKAVAFSFDGDDQDQKVMLAGGESTTVELDIDTGNYAPGTYSYGVSTDDDSESGQITIDESEEPLEPGETNTLTIRGTGLAAQYVFSVTDDLEKSTANNANLNANDEILQGYVGDGEVGTAADSYTFNGSLESLSIAGDAEVSLNGEQLSDAEIDEIADNVIEVEGTGPAAQYVFSVTDSLEKSLVGNANTNANDEVLRGYVGDGEVGTAADGYTFDGSLETLQVDGDAEVYLNGAQLSDAEIDEMADNVIEVEGTGPAAQYAFGTTDDASPRKIVVGNANVNDNDEVFRTTAYGEVGSAADAYAYDAAIDSLNIDGDAEVYVNGRPKDPASEPDHLITIVGTGSEAGYAFGGVSDLSKSSANFANINTNDEIAADSASGEVGLLSDSYVYNGDLAAFDADGDVIVYVDGERIDQNEVASEA